MQQMYKIWHCSNWPATSGWRTIAEGAQKVPYRLQMFTLIKINRSTVNLFFSPQFVDLVVAQVLSPFFLNRKSESCQKPQVDRLRRKVCSWKTSQLWLLIRTNHRSILSSNPAPCWAQLGRHPSINNGPRRMRISDIGAKSAVSKFMPNERPALVCKR